MADLTITDIPDALMEELRRRAEVNQRGIEGEIVALLMQSYGEHPTARAGLNRESAPE